MSAKLPARCGRYNLEPLLKRKCDDDPNIEYLCGAWMRALLLGPWAPHLDPPDYSMRSVQEIRLVCPSCPLALPRHSLIHRLALAGLRFETFVQDAEGVTATFTETKTGAKRELRAPWLVGCDGGGSGVRRRSLRAR
jgi:hypothetical protein